MKRAAIQLLASSWASPALLRSAVVASASPLCGLPAFGLPASSPTPSQPLGTTPVCSGQPCSGLQQLRHAFSAFTRPSSKNYSQRRLLGWVCSQCKVPHAQYIGNGLPWMQHSDTCCFTRRWSQEQLCHVVADVKHYKHFVPWCQRSTVIKHSPDGKYMEAELEVGFQMLVER